jgi:hypothetical protein
MRAILEPGLSGTGPMPVHLHTGRPTPWSEGCVFRFEPDTGPMWIGNLQGGYGYATRIVPWEFAGAVIVIAKGATYFVRPDVIGDWKFIDLLGIDCVLAPSQEVAILSTYNDVVAITRNGSELWRRSVAIDGVEIQRIEKGVVSGLAGIDPPDEWHRFALLLADGTDAEPLSGP